MKRLLFIAALAASATACVEGNNPVQLIGARPVDPACGKPAELQMYRGFLNYSLDNQYIITLGLFSPLSTDDTVGGTGFIGEEIVYNYESKGVKATFKEESLPIYFAVPAGADPEKSFIILDLLGAEARKKLDSLVPTAPDTMTLLSTVKIKGKLASGKSVETNELTFPIEITRAEACPDGARAAPLDNTPCNYPGQDYNEYTCITGP